MVLGSNAFVEIPVADQKVTIETVLSVFPVALSSTR